MSTALRISEPILLFLAGFLSLSVIIPFTPGPFWTVLGAKVTMLLGLFVPYALVAVILSRRRDRSLRNLGGARLSKWLAILAAVYVVGAVVALAAFPASETIQRQEVPSKLMIQVPQIPREELQPITGSEVYFRTKDGKVYFNNYGFSSILYPYSDADTFEVFENDNRLAQDKFYVYSWAYPIEGSDPKTFEVVYPMDGKPHIPAFARDANRVYSFTNAGVTELPIVLTGADPATLKVFDPSDGFGGFAVDKNKLYINGADRVYVVPGIDAATMQYLGGGYIKDSGAVYSTMEGSVIEDADASSFEYIGGSYARDARRAYYNGKEISGADGATFVMVTPDPGYDGAVVKDINRVYRYGKSVEGIQASSFTHVMMCGYVEKSRTHYYKDASQVYIGTTVFEGADSPSFTTYGVYYPNTEMGGSGYAADKNHVYYDCGEILPVADSRTFEPLGNGYSRDSQHYYKQEGSTTTLKIVPVSEYRP